MESRKEYELKLLLDAETNGTFTRTLSKAQQEILSLQKDIQSLSRLQDDINGYQKQQQAVESTNKKLAVLQQQYDNIQREISETGEFSSDLQNKLLAKQQQIDRTSQAIKNQTQKLEQMGTALQEAGVDTGNLQKESARLEAKMGELKQRQEDVADSAESFGTKSAQAFNAVREAIAAAGVAAALHEIYEAYSRCIGVAAGFEESMSNVGALSGASADELSQLSSLAKELGATTKFTARESADAMGYMAMAGWNAEQMIAGMPGVLQLAAASGEGLATVSDIVTDSMTAFGLSAADTSRYADVLAATATNSNTSVSVMGETFKQSASLAGALGYSVEDVSVAIGLMANAGIKHQLKIHYYIRYMDDVIIFAPDKETLNEWKAKIEAFLRGELALDLNGKTSIRPMRQGVEFVGLRIWPTHMKLRKSTVRRLKSEVRKFSERYAAGIYSREEFDRRIASVRGLLEHAESESLRWRLNEIYRAELAKAAEKKLREEATHEQPFTDHSQSGTCDGAASKGDQGTCNAPCGAG